MQQQQEHSIAAGGGDFGGLRAVCFVKHL